MKRSKTLRDAQVRSETSANGQERSGIARNGERPGTFKSERSNALERKVYNGHGTTIRSKALLR
jgi:hypothetical protein